MHLRSTYHLMKKLIQSFLNGFDQNNSDHGVLDFYVGQL